MVTNEPATPCRLLIVDDDQAILDEFCQAFAAQPAVDEVEVLEAELFGSVVPLDPSPVFELTTCTQGAAAIAAVTQACDEQHRFAAAFIDVRMPPGIDGIMAAKQIRQIDPQLPIIFITAFADRKPEELGREVPPPDKIQCVRKPFRIRDFVQMATTLCTP